ncbi:TolB family protein [Nonomuraea sp. NPDC002799]
MTTDLEKALAAELAAAAHHAPGPAGDLRARIEERHRRRRRRGAAMYAAAAVILLSTGVPFVVNVVTPPPPPVATRPPTPGPDPAFPAIEKVWPEAVHLIPANLPGGVPFEPEIFLDDHTVLGTTLKDGHADRLDGLWAYDLTSRTARRLVHVTPPPKTVVTASFISAGGGRLAWWTVRRQQRKLIVDIWAAPAAGGAQRKVTSFEGVPRYGGIDMEIVGDKAVWSRWGKGGVYQVPLSGGTPELLPGTGRDTLITWPWAGTPDRAPGASDLDPLITWPWAGTPDRAAGTPERTAGASDLDPSKKAVIFGDLLDLRTGARSMAAVEPAAACHVTWCVRAGTVARRDGTGERELPGDVQADGPPALDRFLTLFQTGQNGKLRGQVLYDLSTGRGGALGVEPDKKQRLATATLDYRAPGLFWYARDGKLVVVNLTAIT